MNRKDMDDSEPRKQPRNEAMPKRPYQAPTFRVERVFETTALTCGKIQSTQGPCHQNPKMS